MPKLIIQNAVGIAEREAERICARRLSTVVTQPRHGRRALAEAYRVKKGGLDRFGRVVPRTGQSYALARPFVVFVDGENVRQADWSKTKLRAGSVVTIRYLPLGGGGGSGGGAAKGKMIGAALAAILLAVAAPYAAVAITGLLAIKSAMAVGITSALLIAGGSFLINKLLAPRAAKAAADQETRQSYGVSGGGNQPRSQDRIPVIYGKTWHAPDLSQPDFVEYDGDQQILYKRMTVGLGEYAKHKIRVQNTEMWDEGSGLSTSFAGAEIEWIEPGAASVLVPQNVITSGEVSGIELNVNQSYSGPFAVCAPGVEVTRFMVDLSLPRGAKFDNGKGATGGFSVAWVIEYRGIDDDGDPTGTGEWQVAEASFVEPNSTDPYRTTRRFDVASARYEVRVRRNNGIPETAQGTGILSWDQLRATLPDTVVRPNVTELAVRVRSNANLQVTAFQDIQVQVTRKLPIWNGTTWSANTATRSPVWAVCDILRNATYGGSLSDSRLDLATFLSYATTFNSRGDTCDLVIRGPSSVLEAAETALRAGRAQPLNLGRFWSMVRDEAKLSRRMFTGREIVKGTTQVHYVLSPNEGAGDIILEYNKDGDPKQRYEVRATVGLETTTPKRVSIEGITTWEHAWREAQYLAACDVYRRKTVTFQTSLSGRILRRGDPLSVDVHFQSATKVRGVLALDAFTLTLDGDATIDVGDELVLRDRFGREWGPVAVTQGASAREIDLDTVDVAFIEGQTGIDLDEVLNLSGTGNLTSARIGPSSVIQVPMSVVSARATQNSTRVEITAIVDPAAVHTADGGSVPSEPVIPSRPTIPAILDLPFMFARSDTNGNTLELAWAVPAVLGAVRYFIEISYDGGDTRIPIYDGTATSGKTQIRPNALVVFARAFGANGNQSNERNVALTAPTTFPFYADDLAPNLVGNGELDRVLARLMNPSFRGGTLIDYVPSAMLAQAIDLQDIRQVTESIAGVWRARIETIRRTLVTETTALAQLIDALSAVVEDPVTGIAAVATAVDSLTAVVDDPGTGLVATAAAVTALEAEVGDFTAQGEVGFVTTATGSGALASWRVRLRVGTGGSWQETGLRLDALSGGNTRLTVDAQVMNFIASSFQIYDSGVASGTPIPVFGVSGGAFTMNGNVAINGSLVVAGTISAGKIAAAARSQQISSSGGSASITTNGGRVKLVGKIEWNQVAAVNNASGGQVGTYSIFKNGVQQGTNLQAPLNMLSLNTATSANVVGAANATFGGITFFEYADTPSAGSYTYSILGVSGSGLSGTATFTVEEFPI